MSWFSHNCETDGHRLEGRYDRVFSQDLVARITRADGNLDHLKEQIYVHDICVRCGAVFSRGVKGCNTVKEQSA